MIHDKYHFVGQAASLYLQVEQGIGMDIIPICNGCVPYQAFEVNIGVLPYLLKFFADSGNKGGINVVHLRGGMRLTDKLGRASK